MKRARTSQYHTEYKKNGHIEHIEYFKSAIECNGKIHIEIETGKKLTLWKEHL